MTTSLRTLSLALAAMTSISLAGCTLYFGDDDNSDDDGRPWSDDGPSDDGYYCSSDRQCAEGCYCDPEQGVCVEAGFCDSDDDCGDGYVCDKERDSCVPGDTCSTDADCTAGSFCQDGTCQTSCVCTTDADAQAAGFGYCDEDRGTCMPESDAGSCGGAATGQPPACAEGQVPLIKDGAYTGQCQTITQCDVVPVCQAFQYESDCLNPSDTDTCGASYLGINCHKPDGSACTAGSGSGCMCDEFRYSSCVDQGAGGIKVLEGTQQPLQSVMSSF